MMKKLFAKIAAIVAAISLSCQPAYAVSDLTIMSEISSASSETRFTFEDASKDSDALFLRFTDNIYKTNPELFYTGDWWSGITLYSNDTAQPWTSVSFSDRIVAAYRDDTYDDQVDAYIDSVIAEVGVMHADTDASKIKKLVSFIDRNYVYDCDGAVAAYDCGISFWVTLTSKQKTFCMMDALLFKGCCDRLGIPCHYITGMASGEYHAWNRVCVDGKWSEVDATFARISDDTRIRDAFIMADLSGIYRRTITYEIG